MKNKNLKQNSFSQKRLSKSDQMLLVGISLALVYWLIETMMQMFFSNKFNFFTALIGSSLDESWPRLVVLCLFVIFGSHAQFTINSRKEAEDALRISEERFRTLVENVPIGIIRTHPDRPGRILMVNPACLKMFGYDSEDEIRQLSIADIFLDVTDKNSFFTTLFKNNNIFWHEVRLIKKDKTSFWGSVTARLSNEDNTDENQYIDCTIEDVNERKLTAEKMKEDAATRQRFQRLLSPDLAEMVVSGQLKVEKGGEDRVATVMFADIRNFTAMSENMPATEVLKMLNEYFEVVVEIAFLHEGTVDKFIGDGIMLVWGAPVVHEDDPARSLRAALDIQAMVLEFNNNRQSQGIEPIQVGIGINTGHLVAGYIGANRTMSYSVIGDTVNTASRLCSAAKGGQILISENTTSQTLKDSFNLQELEPIIVKGKNKPVKVFEALGDKRPSNIRFFLN